MGIISSVKKGYENVKNIFTPREKQTTTTITPEVRSVTFDTPEGTRTEVVRPSTTVTTIKGRKDSGGSDYVSIARVSQETVPTSSVDKGILIVKQEEKKMTYGSPKPVYTLQSNNIYDAMNEGSFLSQATFQNKKINTLEQYRYNSAVANLYQEAFKQGEAFNYERELPIAIERGRQEYFNLPFRTKTKLIGGSSYVGFKRGGVALLEAPLNLGMRQTKGSPFKSKAPTFPEDSFLGSFKSYPSLVTNKWYEKLESPQLISSFAPLVPAGYSAFSNIQKAGLLRGSLNTVSSIGQTFNPLRVTPSTYFYTDNIRGSLKYTFKGGTTERIIFGKENVNINLFDKPMKFGSTDIQFTRGGSGVGSRIIESPFIQINPSGSVSTGQRYFSSTYSIKDFGFGKGEYGLSTKNKYGNIDLPLGKIKGGRSLYNEKVVEDFMVYDNNKVLNLAPNIRRIGFSQTAIKQTSDKVYPFGSGQSSFGFSPSGKYRSNVKTVGYEVDLNRVFGLNDKTVSPFFDSATKGKQFPQYRTLQTPQIKQPAIANILKPQTSAPVILDNPFRPPISTGRNYPFTVARTTNINIQTPYNVPRITPFNVPRITPNIIQPPSNIGTQTTIIGSPQFEVPRIPKTEVPRIPQFEVPRVPAFNVPQILTPRSSVVQNGTGWGFPDLSGFDSSAFFNVRYKAKQKKKYTPSYESFVFNIRGRKPKGVETGLRIRPIPKGFSFGNNKKRFKMLI